MNGFLFAFCDNFNFFACRNIASSGAIGVLLALVSCKSVTVAGFGTSIHSGNGHYWAKAGDV